MDDVVRVEERDIIIELPGLRLGLGGYCKDKEEQK